MTTDDGRADLDRYCERLKHAARGLDALLAELRELSAGPPPAESSLTRGRLDRLWADLALGASHPDACRHAAERFQALAQVALPALLAVVGVAPQRGPGSSADRALGPVVGWEG
jgi:hypothetical protein